MSEAKWDNYLRDIKSKATYIQRVDDYLTFCTEGPLDSVNPASLELYLESIHEEYGGSTLWNINSMICAWFINRHNISPMKVPLTLKGKSNFISIPIYFLPLV